MTIKKIALILLSKEFFFYMLPFLSVKKNLVINIYTIRKFMECVIKYINFSVLAYCNLIFNS